MMMNYLKSEWFRIVRGKSIYLFTFILAGMTLALNILLLVVGQADPVFRYDNVHFSLSNLIANMSMLLAIAAVLVAVLYDDDRKNGTLKNSITEGMSRTQLFTAKALICAIFSIFSMAFILLVYIGSAMLLLEGPAAESVSVLLGGMVTAFPSILAAMIFMLACLHIFNSPTKAILLWATIIYIIPVVLNLLGLYFEPVAAIAGWMPANYLSSDLSANMSGFIYPWAEPSGITKWLVAGIGFAVVFAILGVWRTKKMEL